MPTPKTEYILSAKDKTAASFNSAERRMKKLGRAAGNLKRNLTLVGLAAGGGVLGRDLISAGQRMEGFRNSLVATEGSAAGSESAIRFLREESERLGIEFETVVKSFTKFSAASKGTIVEGEKGREIFSSMAEAGRVLNLSADDMHGVFKSLEQMLNKGTVQAEELRGQLGERLPGAFRLAAESMGKTTEELGDMLKRGEVLAEDLLPKMAKLVKETYGDALPLAVNSAAASMARFKNAIFELRVAISEGGAMDAFANTLDVITKGLRMIIPHIHIIIDGFVTLGKILAAGVGLIAFNAALTITNKLFVAGAIHVASYVTAIVSGVGPITLFTNGLRSMAVATWANIRAFGIFRTVLTGLFAVWSGMQVGKWVNDNFPQVNIAIDKSIGKMIEGIHHLEFFGKAALALMKAVVVESVNAMLDKLRKFTGFLSSVADKVGLDGLSNELARASIGVSDLSGGFDDFRDTLVNLRAERDEDIRLTKAATEAVVAATEAQIKLDEAKKNASLDFELPEFDPTLKDPDSDSSIISEFDSIRNSLLSKERLEVESHQRRLEAINAFASLSEDNAKRAESIREQEMLRHIDNLNKIEKDGWTARQKFENLSFTEKAKTVFGELASITQGVAQHNRALFEINKVAAISNAGINAYAGASKSLATYSWPLANIMAGIHLAAGLAQVKAIKNTSFSGGGGGSVPSSVGSVPTVNNTPVQPINNQSQSDSIVQVIVVGGGSPEDVDIDGVLEAMTDAFNQDRVIIEPNTRQAQELAKVASNI